MRWADARDKIARLRAENERLRAELAGLQQQLEELERRLGLNSGQPGHKGATLRQTGPH